MALAQYSITNLSNSLATHLAGLLITDGYLIYWRSLDALQTADGLYTSWSELQTSILADPDVAAEYAASRGIISLIDPDVAVPGVAVRPTVEGEVVGPESLPVPSMAIQVEHAPSGSLQGLGSKVRERWAVLSIVGYGRDLRESLYLTERLRGWFDDLTYVPMRNHDDGSLAVLLDLEVHDCAVTSAVVPLKQEAQVYEIALSANLRYEA
jgi:hypothetical protein